MKIYINVKQKIKCNYADKVQYSKKKCWQNYRGNHSEEKDYLICK